MNNFSNIGEDKTFLRIGINCIASISQSKTVKNLAKSKKTHKI